MGKWEEIWEELEGEIGSGYNKNILYKSLKEWILEEKETLLVESLFIPQLLP